MHDAANFKICTREDFEKAGRADIYDEKIH